jgi:hypothetical protein
MFVAAIVAIGAVFALLLVIVAARQRRDGGKAMAKLLRDVERTGRWPERPPRETGFRTWQEVQDAWARRPQEVDMHHAIDPADLPRLTRWRITLWHARVLAGIRMEMWMRRRLPWLWRLWSRIATRLGWVDERSRVWFTVGDDGPEH